MLLADQAVLFYGDRFCQIARLVHIAAAPDRNVVSKQLQGHDLDQRRKQFHRRGNMNHLLHQFSDSRVAVRGYCDHSSRSRCHFLNIRQSLLVPQLLSRIGLIARGQNNHWERLVDQCVWPMLHFAGRVPFGVDV